MCRHVRVSVDGLGARGRICADGEMMTAWLQDLAASGQHQEPPTNERLEGRGMPAFLASCRVRLVRPGVIAIEESSHGPLQIGKPRAVDSRPG
jgi:hypothetical protein